ncbi:DNA-binding protein [Pectobacterium colocasium]|uniref:DNA-binding protein n=1 Tax=Pectobacterium colocasium TaxID=2878098 RepID=UPI003B27D234
MSGQFTVSEFVIEMSFDPSKVMSGLRSLENKVNASAQKFEARLNRAFSKDFTKGFSQNLKRMEANASKSGNNINRVLSRSLQVRGVQTGLFTRFEREGTASAARVQSALERALNVRRTAAGNPLGNGNSSRPSRDNFANARMRQVERIHALNNGSIAQRLEAGGHTDQLRQYRMAMRDAAVNSGGDMRQFRMAMREAISSQQVFLRSQSFTRNSALHAAATNNALTGLTGNLGALTAVVFSVRNAFELFTESLKQGIERTQASTMMSSAYGDNTKNMNRDVAEYSRKYGVNQTDAMKQAAVLKQTMGQAFSDSEIVPLLENMSVFAHNTGMTTQQQQGLAYVMAQEAGANKGGQGNNYRQVLENAPALIPAVAKLLNIKIGDVKAKANSMTGQEWDKTMSRAMDKMNRDANAYEKTQHSIAASQGRYQNAVANSQISFFKGFEGGLRSLFDSSSSMLDSTSGLTFKLGEALGWVLEQMARNVRPLAQWGARLDGYLTLFGIQIDEWKKSQPWFDKVSEVMGKLSSSTFDWLAMGTTIALFAGVMGKLKGLLGLGSTAGALAGTGFWSLAGKAFGVAAVIELAKNANGMNEFATDLANKTRSLFGMEPNKPRTAQEIADDPNVSSLRKWFSATDVMLGRKFNAWANDPNVPLFSGNWKGASLPPRALDSFPSRDAVLQLSLNQKPLQLLPFTINIKQPDGSMTQQTVQAQLENHFDSTLVSANGLAGAWQKQGNNAGFTPSLLQRNPN